MAWQRHGVTKLTLLNICKLYSKCALFLICIRSMHAKYRHSITFWLWRCVCTRGREIADWNRTHVSWACLWFEKYAAKLRLAIVTSCSTSIGISRTPLLIAVLNGLCDRLGDNDRSTENRGLMQEPLLDSGGSGLNGISTIGLGERCGLKSLFERKTLWIGHGAFFDIVDWCSHLNFTMSSTSMESETELDLVRMNNCKSRNLIAIDYVFWRNFKSKMTKPRAHRLFHSALVKLLGIFLN